MASSLASASEEAIDGLVTERVTGTVVVLGSAVGGASPIERTCRSRAIGRVVAPAGAGAESRKHGDRIAGLEGRPGHVELGNGERHRGGLGLLGRERAGRKRHPGRKCG